MDNLTTCERCGSDACYIQEVNDEIKNYQCMGCGFITNTLMREDSDFFKEQMELLPNLYKELMGEDESGKVWMPATINIPEQGMVFAHGANIESWKWGAVKSITVKGDEMEKYPIPGKAGEFYKKRMDMDTIKEFDEGDFIEALDYIGIFENPQK
jgi:ribosomal protein L37E